MKNINYILALTIGLLLFASCKNSTKKQTDEDSLKEVTVAQFGQEKYLMYLPFYVAQEKGFFEKEGLSINIKYSGNDDQVFATVLKGDAMFGLSDPIFTAVAREKGAKGKVVASIVNGVAMWGLTTQEKNISEITKAEDLANLKIGTFPSPSTVYTLMRNTLNTHSLGKADIVQAPIGSQIALLEKGVVDIAIEIEPAVSIAQSNGYKVVYSAAKFYGPFAFTGISTTEENIEKNPETVQKFVNAIEKALVFIYETPEDAVIIAQSLFPSMDNIVVEKAVRRMIEDKTIPTHANVTNESWQQAMKIRQQIGDLKEIKPTEDAVDNSFAVKAQTK